jgi:hypothetical protein
LSLAPGTIGLRATSAKVAAAIAEPATPAASGARRPRRAPAATSSGAASRAHHRGKEVSIRSTRPGNVSPSHAWKAGSKIAPVRAASWWASTTSVRGSSGAPHAPTTFQVVFGFELTRRNTRGPLEMSSAIAAATTAAAAPARRRAGASARAVIPAPRLAADSARITSA